MSAPTVSNPAAMAEYRHARERERTALLDGTALRPGSVVVDLQAAGGYLADGAVTCICVGPTAELSRRIRPVHRICEDPLDNPLTLPAQSVDTVLGLVALHHSPSHARNITEAYRILKPGGWLVVCEVLEHSKMARWLNGFVNRHNPAGHHGTFVRTGRIADHLLHTD